MPHADHHTAGHPEVPAPASPGVRSAAETLAATRGLLAAAGADVGADRESRRRGRLLAGAAVVAVLAAWVVSRVGTGQPLLPVPKLDAAVWVEVVFFGCMIGVLGATMFVPARSPHVAYRPDQISVGLDDVKGIDPVKEEVVRSLNLFLAHKTFARDMGGTPRRGLLFEGAPGTGKTHLAKAMAREAGVPFLFVSATSFQSMFYGATAKKIRAYFKQLRKAARRHGGAIGFIEEIDAIAISRRGVAMTQVGGGIAPASAVTGCGGLCGLPAAYALEATPATVSPMISEGTGGVVNELLVQMQSFDTPTVAQRAGAVVVDLINGLLPAHRQLHRPAPTPANILLIAATNRADALDPALLRPGRFDRRLSFDLPAKASRRELIDLFLSRKSHEAELDEGDRRDALAAVTTGYTPVMIEHLLDEALVFALRRGATAMCWQDVERARLTEEVGLGQPVAYTDHERRLIATHEAGHATVAWLTAPERRLEVLSIIKRQQALGMLAHGDAEDVYTRSRSEMLGLIRIAMGGQVAEEIFFHDVSTGPAGDLLYATNVAAEMVGSAGMTDSLISLRAVQSGAFSDTNIVGRVLGDPDSRATVERLLHEQKAAVVTLLTAHQHLVEALRDALLERHELIGAEIGAVLEAAYGAARPVRAALIDLTTDAPPAPALPGAPPAVTSGGPTAGGGAPVGTAQPAARTGSVVLPAAVAAPPPAP